MKDYCLQLNKKLLKLAPLAAVLTLVFFGLKVLAPQQIQAASGINTQLNYQGKLTYTAGTQVSDGNWNFRFRIYDASSGGNLLWTERWTSTTTRGATVNGVFSAALGSLGQTDLLTDIDWNSDSLYLQIDLDADNNGTWEENFTTRKRLTSSAYAFNADQLDGYHATTTAAASSTIPVFDKDLTLNLFDGGVSSTRATTSELYINATTTLSTDGGKIITLMPTPGAPSVTGTTGGSLAADTYYYAITALDANSGESTIGTQSAAVTIAPGDDGNGRVELSWTHVQGANSYKIYRTTTSGSYTDPCYLDVVTNPTHIYTDDAASASSGAPPAVNAAYLNYLDLANSGNDSWLRSGGNITFGTTTAYLAIQEQSLDVGGGSVSFPILASRISTGSYALVPKDAIAILGENVDPALYFYSATGDTPSAYILFSRTYNWFNISTSTNITWAGDGAPTALKLKNTSKAVDNGMTLMFSTPRTYGIAAAGTDVAGVKGIITDIGQTTYKGALIFSTANADTPAEVARFDHLGSFGLATTTQDYKFVIASSTGTGYFQIASSTNENILVVNTDGRVGIGTSTPSATLAISDASTNPDNTIYADSGAVLTVGGVWTDASSIELKENFNPLDNNLILEKIVGLNLQEYNYIRERDEIKHFGATAEDWYGTFGLGDDKTISGKDTAMVALAGIQALSARIDGLNLNNTTPSSAELLTVIDNPDLNAKTLAVQEVATFYGTIYVRGEAGFEGKVVFNNDIEVKGKIYASADQAGTAAIAAGAAAVEIIFAEEYEIAPKIAATAKRPVALGVSDQSAKGFRVFVSEPVSEDLIFDWLALAVKDGGTVAGGEFEPVLGCLDSAASNHNALATQDDGSCLYPAPAEPAAEPSAEPAVEPAIEPAAEIPPTEPVAVEPAVILGCLDTLASNYNPSATQDDGSCVYPAPAEVPLAPAEPTL